MEHTPFYLIGLYRLTSPFGGPARCPFLAVGPLPGHIDGVSTVYSNDGMQTRDVTGGDGERLFEEFESHRAHLRAVAYRMLGSLDEAEDAVQEAWLRLSRSEAGSLQNVRGWLTTVVARVCLDMLRSRKARRETLGCLHL